MNNKNYDRGNNIATKRKNLGLSQDAFAEEIGIGRQAVSAIENGGDFKVSVLEKMTIALDCTSDELLYSEQVEKKSQLLNQVMYEFSKMGECEINKWLLMIKAVKGVEN